MGMEKGLENFPKPLSLKEKIKDHLGARREAFKTALPEGMIGVNVLYGLEVLLREAHIKPDMWKIYGGGVKWEERLFKPETNPRLLEVLHNLGDFPDGYALAFAAYNILNLVSPRKMSETAKIGLAFIIGSAVVTAYESGLLFKGGTPDYADIPAGVFGVIAYVGVHQLSKLIVKGIDKRTKELQAAENPKNLAIN